MSEALVAAMGRALAFCASNCDSSIEGLIERAAWELYGEIAGEISSLACLVKRRDGSSFVGRSRELSALPVETLFGMLAEEEGAYVSCRVRDHALDTIRFIDARFRTSIIVRVSMPRLLSHEGDVALWFGLQGPATPKKVELAQSMGRAVSDWFGTNAPTLVAFREIQARSERLKYLLQEMTAVAHDVRAPLGALQYFLTDLSMGRPELLGDITRLRTELQYVDALLGAFSPQRECVGKTPRGETDLCEMIQKVCRRLMLEVHSKGGYFDSVFPPNERLITAVPALDIERVLTNVLGNAVKYAGSERIAIEASRADRGDLCVTVSDRGPGFSESVLEEISSAGETTTVLNQAKGWGVGLVSSKRRLCAFGGNISLESIDKGSRVTIRLPEATDARLQKSSIENVQGVRERVDLTYESLGDVGDLELIIVDDDGEYASSLERVLATLGIRTRSFLRIEDAFSFIRRAMHVCVLCDVHIPGGGAEKLLQMLRSLKHRVPCAVMSGETSDEILYRFAALGACEFFAKPTAIDNLARWIHQTLGEQRMSAVCNQGATQGYSESFRGATQGE